MAKSNTNSTKLPSPTNGFTFFEGLSTENASAPRITIRRNSLLVLTSAAVDMLEAGSTHVKIGFDDKSKSIGLQSAPAGAKGSYRLRSQKQGASKAVDGKRFLAHLGISFEKAESFDAEEFGSGIVGLRLPA